MNSIRRYVSGYILRGFVYSPFYDKVPVHIDNTTGVIYDTNCTIVISNKVFIKLIKLGLVTMNIDEIKDRIKEQY